MRRYLEGLQARPLKRGPKRAPEVIQARLSSINEAMLTASVVEELALRQQRRSLEAELASVQPVDDLSAREQGFCEVAASYSERKGIDYATWREMGVPAAVLRAAGVEMKR